MINILFFGPLGMPVTGQSYSFENTIKELQKNKKVKSFVVIDTNLEARNIFTKLMLTTLIFIKLIFSRFSSIDTVYFTPSRSKFGALKDFFLLSLFYKSRIIAHVHGADFKRFYLEIIKGSIFESLYDKIDSFIFLSKTMKSEVEHLLPCTSNKIVITNFHSFENEINVASKVNEPVVLTFFSNFMCSKGVLDAIRVFLVLEKKYTEKKFQLNLIGKPLGDYLMSKSKLEVEMNRLISMSNNINLVGPVYGLIEKKALLDNSDAILFPSYYRTEAIPISVIESLSCGNYMFVLEHNYIADILSPDYTYFFKIKNHFFWADVIFNTVTSCSFMKSKDLAMKDGYNFNFNSYIKKIQNEVFL